MEEKTEEVIDAQVAEFRKFLEQAQILGHELVQRIKSEDGRDIAATLLYIRAIRFFSAYTHLVEQRLGEPASTILRSVYEASLRLRWVLISPEHGDGYLNTGLEESMRVRRQVEPLLQRIGWSLPDLSEFKEARKRRGTFSSSPGWEKMAKAVGLKDLHLVVYSWLSAAAHGTLMGYGEQIPRKLVRSVPDDSNLLPLFPIGHNVFWDCMRVYGTWFRERKIHPPPDVISLLMKE